MGKGRKEDLDRERHAQGDEAGSEGEGRALGAGRANRPRQSISFDVPASQVAPPELQKTVPGTHMAFALWESRLGQENLALRTQLGEVAFSALTRPLDPRAVRCAPWADRHPSAYMTRGFANLKARIEVTGGNVVAIKVRRIPEEPGHDAHAAAATTPKVVPRDEQAHMPTYEIVYGHLRLRACLDLDYPVLCTIAREPMSEAQQFMEMVEENAGRSKPSAFEMGVRYRHALERGLYASPRQLAAALNLSTRHVLDAIALARLPPEVIEAFASPLVIQARWAQTLAMAQREDPQSMIARALSLRLDGQAQPVASVVGHLVGTTHLGGRGGPLAARA
jgi:ParB family chromosome partitioning protein